MHDAVCSAHRETPQSGSRKLQAGHTRKARMKSFVIYLQTSLLCSECFFNVTSILATMPIPIQIDPFGIVINSAALLVAILQLCLMWRQQRMRRPHRLHEIDDGNSVGFQVRRKCQSSTCMNRMLSQHRRTRMLATPSKKYLLRQMSLQFPPRSENIPNIDVVVEGYVRLTDRSHSRSRLCLRANHRKWR